MGMRFDSSKLRVELGQFQTPAILCDWMLALLAPTASERLLDPGCGNGAFLMRAYERGRLLHNLPRSTCLSYLYGVDCHPESVETAQRRLSEAGNVPSEQIVGIRVEDFLAPGMAEWGTFDVIVGNPPYIRQERLNQDAAFQWDKRLQTLRESYVDYLAAYPEQSVLWSRKLDLYLAFFLQAGFLLKPGGRLAFVTSNSWLSSAIGRFFRRFLHHFFHVRLLAESACERWFAGAAVNAVIVLLEKRTGFHLPDHSEESLDESVRVLRFLRPLSACTPDPASADYWRTLDEWAAAIRLNAIQTDGLDEIVGCSSELPTERPSRAFALKMQPIGRFHTEPFSGNWALVLRAPHALWDWLERDALWRRLDTWGVLRYSLKTGINRFFYLTRQQVADWKIEPEFLMPVVRSARRVTHWIIEPDAGETSGTALPESGQTDFLFVCRASLKSLADTGKTGALAYIRWGESQVAPPRQKRKHAVPWPQVVSVRRARQPWYAIQPLPPAHLLCNRFLDRRFFFPVCRGNMLEDQTFYGLTLSDADPAHVLFAAALMNGTLSFALLEFNARGSLGDGALQYARGDMAALPVLHPSLYTSDDRAALTEAFRHMATRPILPLEAELSQPDRQALDALILRPLVAHLPGRPSVSAYREALASHLLARLSERSRLVRSKPPSI